MGALVSRGGSDWKIFRGKKVSKSMRRIAYSVEYGSAAFLLMRLQDFVNVGGFPEVFAPAHYGDTDLCFILTQENQTVVVGPKAIVYHLKEETAGTSFLQGFNTLQTRNQTQYYSQWKDRLRDRKPVSEITAFNHILHQTQRQVSCERRCLLWVHPHLPRPGCEGGDARIMKEIGLLTAQGHHFALWAEDIGDYRKYGPLFESMGIRWFGYQEPTRWPLNGQSNHPGRSLQELLRARWDGVIIWSAEMAKRFIPLVRDFQPDIPVIVDNGVLLYLQSERGKALDIKTPKSIHSMMAWAREPAKSAKAWVSIAKFHFKIAEGFGASH